MCVYVWECVGLRVCVCLCVLIPPARSQDVFTMSDMRSEEFLLVQCLWPDHRGVLLVYEPPTQVFNLGFGQETQGSCQVNALSP